MKQSGYSGTPLIKKLGIKSGFTIRVVYPPNNYSDFFTDFPFDVKQINDITVKKDFIHYFTKDTLQLMQDIPDLSREIKDNGMIWISWPKKSSKIPTDLNENIIRSIALRNDLVDVKVCAINEIWSGLKLVIPLAKRA